MKSLNSKAHRLSLMAAGVVGILGAGVPAASAQQQIPQGWFKACTKQEDVDICNVQNIQTAGNGQLITGVSLIDLRGKVNRKVFQVTVPSGRLVPPGIALQIDNNKAQKLDYVICFPDRCVAEVPLTDQLVTSFKKGQQITLTSINFQAQPNPIKIPLTGFGTAFDGPAMQQSDIEDRQKKLQEFVNKNNQDFSKKLKEEQEKAKTAQ
ncbi:MAG TPA: invasion associated locus B family protein [Mesorhizobium sp.]|jgi:invasion protein IalB|uniref:invasion associated locus B family protein n=1 Tax=Mesorhizobium TaxID=68287 RepID=UPI001010C89B|nr:MULTISPECIES: invasion associated locus B family protein [Mesorhizobium]MBR2687011.1 invasion associated locus B family protein [Aquamicrobium sp.]QAZ41615.1 invasion-associated locus B family protein [Mesorhizobium sp. Pch-S]HEV2503394.1 invasion associated locus B family protein [Mesorhizobium sp.]